MPFASRVDVAVIGAGLAGLACARQAAAAGLSVAVLDKGRGPGGRLSTRRFETPLGEAAVDHGAQFFTARDPAFVRQVKSWTAAGVVQPWAGRLVRFEGAAATAMPAEARHVGTPGMSAIVRAMAEGLDVRWGLQAADVRREAGLWEVRGETGAIARARAVIVATPAEQAAPLLAEASPALAAEADAARTAPCWAAWAVFEAPGEAEFDAARLEEGALAWIARNSSKPGREGPETWVMHANPDWSRANLALTPEQAAKRLLAAMRRRVKADAPVALMAHRWRYAQVEEAAGAPFGWDADRLVGACGDWRLGARVELAWLSGDGLGAAVAAALSRQAA